MRRIAVVVGLIVGILVMPVAASATEGPPGSTAGQVRSCSTLRTASLRNACTKSQIKLCERGGYRNYTTSRGKSFTSQADCVRYVKSGCRLVPKRPQPCVYDATLTSTDPGCQPPVMCQYDPTIPATDPACVEPPAVTPSLTLSMAVYNTCQAAGTLCFLGVDGAGLKPGSTVGVYTPGVCCDMNYVVAANGTIAVHGIFICGGESSAPIAFAAHGVALDGTEITTDPVILPPGISCAT